MKDQLRSLSLLVAFALALPLFAGPGFSPKVPDLVQGKDVAVNFVFTNCSTICPASGAMFATLQKQSGQGVRFISVSIDPGYDTPEWLAAWSRRFRTQPGWVLVTGEQSAIDAIVKAFGAANARPQDHQPLTIIGSDATQTWAKLYGFPDAEKVRSVVAQVQKNARKGEAR